MDSLLVCLYHVLQIFAALRKAQVHGSDLDFVHGSLVFDKPYHLAHTLFYAEYREGLCEASLGLIEERVVEDVVDEEVDEVHC